MDTENDLGRINIDLETGDEPFRIAASMIAYLLWPAVLR